MEVSKQEVVDYYNRFYSEDDFHYYPQPFTRRVLHHLCGHCGIEPGSRILDVGCGTGFYTNIFHSLGYDVLGIDISQSGIARARQQYPDASFEVADATTLPYPRDSFDLIFAMGVSVANTKDFGELHSFIRHLMQFVRPAGRLLFIGGSNLRGETASTSSWYYHTWDEIRQFMPTGQWTIDGPYLSHFRLIHSLPFLSFNRLTTHLLRILGGDRERKVLYFLNKHS